MLLIAPVVGCGTADDDPGDAEQLYPDVIGVTVRRGPEQTLRFDVTISSPYDSPSRYADAWRVVGADDTVYAIRELLHDHASEQPFMRSVEGVEIPDDVEVVVVEARDLVNGWGGTTMEAALPGLTETGG